MLSSALVTEHHCPIWIMLEGYGGRLRERDRSKFVVSVVLFNLLMGNSSTSKIFIILHCFGVTCYIILQILHKMTFFLILENLMSKSSGYIVK